MSDPLLIELTPTGRIEKLHGFQFRVYRGRTNTGATLEMLGLFRVDDVEKRAEFERAVCAVGVDDPEPVTLLTEHELVRP